MKNFVFLVCLFSVFTVSAQIKIDSFFTLSGSADTYFRSNFNSTNNMTNGGTTAPATSFGNLPGFSIGMFNLVGKYETAKSGFVADLVFGPRGKDAVFNSVGSLNIVNQAYAYYNPTEKLSFTLGKFNTFLGYEVISPLVNYHYSTSYMFSYGPFSHAGFKINYDLGDGFGAMAGIFNPTDFTDFNPDGTFFFGGQLSFTKDKGSIYLNTLLNDEFSQFDLTTTLNISDDFHVGLNATTASDNFYGAAIYTDYRLSNSFSMGIRGEYFKDNGIGILEGTETQFSNDVLNITLSGNITLGQLRLIPELRMDMFSDNLIIPDFTKAGRSDKLSSFLVAAVYGF